MTDYTTMSGAEFRRAVGVNPEKWAEAFCQRVYAEEGDGTYEERVAHLADWFRDAMEAAVRGANIAPDGESATLGDHMFPMRAPAEE